MGLYFFLVGLFISYKLKHFQCIFVCSCGL